MSQRISEQPVPRQLTDGAAAVDEPSQAEGTGSAQVLERVLSQIESRVEFDTRATEAKLERQQPGPALMVGWVDAWDGRAAVLVSLLDGTKASAALLPELDRAIIEEAMTDRQLVLLSQASAKLTVVGSICTRKPKTVKLEAEHVEVSGTKSILLKSGRAALELRQDGSIELVGSRISAVSRGLFRIVGRMLRLN